MDPNVSIEEAWRCIDTSLDACQKAGGVTARYVRVDPGGPASFLSTVANTLYRACAVFNDDTGHSTNTLDAIRRATRKLAKRVHVDRLDGNLNITPISRWLATHIYSFCTVVLSWGDSDADRTLLVDGWPVPPPIALNLGHTSLGWSQVHDCFQAYCLEHIGDMSAKIRLSRADTPVQPQTDAEWAAFVRKYLRNSRWGEIEDEATRERERARYEAPITDDDRQIAQRCLDSMTSRTSEKILRFQEEIGKYRQAAAAAKRAKTQGQSPSESANAAPHAQNTRARRQRDEARETGERAAREAAAESAARAATRARARQAAREAAAEARARAEEARERARQAEEARRQTEEAQRESARQAEAEARAAEERAAASRRARPDLPVPQSMNDDHVGIECIDGVPWDKVMHNPFSMVDDIPTELQQDWARVVGKVLRNAINAHMRDDRTVLTRWLKLWRMLGQLLLRIPPRGGQRGSRRIHARFKAIVRGDYRTLLAWWRTDLAHSRFQKRPASNDELKITERAAKLVERYCLSKAARLTTSKGVADFKCADIQQQMNNKFPERKQALPSSLEQFDHFEPLSLNNRQSIRKLTRGAAPGPDGMHPEYYTSLTLAFTDDAAKAGLTAFNEFSNLFANGLLPDWYYYVTTASTLVPIIKTLPVDPAQAPDARPVQIGNVECRVVGNAVLQVHEGPLRDFYEPIQLGPCTQGGLELLVHTIRMHFELFPAHIAIKLDIKNMFNEIKRALSILKLEQIAELRTMVPFLWAVLSPESPVFYPDGTPANFASAEGGRQGAPEAGHVACVPLQEILKRAHDMVNTHDGFVRADFDDAYIVGQPEQVAEAYMFVHHALKQIGATLQSGKSTILLGARTRELPADFPGRSTFDGSQHTIPIGAVRVTDPDDPLFGFEIGRGIEVAGIPLGDRTYIAEMARRKGAKYTDKFEQLAKKFEAKYGYHLFILTKYCLQPTGVYFARNMYPTDSAPMLRQIDGKVIDLLQRSFNQSFDDDLSPRERDLLRSRIEIPNRNGGLGVRNNETLRSAAFAASVLDTIPRLVDRSLNGGRIEGFATWLGGMIGIGSFDDGNESSRLEHFLAHGGETANQFRMAWEELVRRTGVQVSDGTRAAHTPLAWPIEAAGLQSDEYTPMQRAQSHLTKQLEDYASDQLTSGMATLPHDSELKTAYFNRGTRNTSTQWAKTVPNRNEVPNNLIWVEGVAASLGLSSPVCEREFGLLSIIPRQSSILKFLGSYVNLRACQFLASPRTASYVNLRSLAGKAQSWGV